MENIRQRTRNVVIGGDLIETYRRYCAEYNIEPLDGEMEYLGVRDRGVGNAAAAEAERYDVDGTLPPGLAVQAREGCPFPLVLDQYDTLFHRFKVTRLPTMVVIDAQGRVVRRVEGEDIHVAGDA